MKRKSWLWVVLATALLLGVLISACSSAAPDAAQFASSGASNESPTASLAENAGKTAVPEEGTQAGSSGGSSKGALEAAPAAAQESDGEDPDAAEGADEQPGDAPFINPLTGLPAENEDWLYKRPIMVAISNFPPSAIPHSGESFAAMVFELFQGYGMTRNLAVFYGDYAEQIEGVLGNRLAEGGGTGQVIGPVRSGRVVFEDVKTLFPHALLITAGASPDVKAQLSNRVSVYGSDPNDINSTGVGVDQLGSLANYPVDPSEYVGLTFDEAPPQDGQPAPFFRVIYNLYNQIGWEYSPEQGAYLRSHDKADGTGELFPETDRLTGEQLAFENVVVLWAKHRYVTPTVVEMALVFVKGQNGLLFRDGVVTPIKWSTLGGVLTIHDEEGNPVPLKPGQTFFEVVSYETTWNPETMILRFHEPPRNE